MRIMPPSEFLSPSTVHSRPVHQALGQKRIVAAAMERWHKPEARVYINGLTRNTNAGVDGIIVSD